MIIREHNLEKWLFDYFEGNLTDHEMIELDNFIRQNPNYQEEFDAWEQSYKEQKEEVKKNRVPIYAGASALLVETGFWARFNWKIAAVFLLLIGGAASIGYVTQPSENNGEAEVISFSPSSSDKIDENKFQLEQKESGKESTDAEKNLNFESLVVSNLKQNNSEDGELKQGKQEHNFNATEVSQVANWVDNLILDVEGYSTKSDDLNNVTINQYIPLANNDAFPKEDKVISIKAKNIQNKHERIAVSHSIKKKKQRYFYQGYKNVANRGIGVSSKRIKENELAKNEDGTELNPFISEQNMHGNKKYHEKAKRRKVAGNPLELGLVNLYDPIFIQINSHPLLVNSGVVGTIGLPRVKMNTRIQNNNSIDKLVSSTVSYDMFINKIKAGVGIIANYQNFGSGMYKNNTFGFVYGQKFEINREASLTTSVKYTLESKVMNGDKMIYGNTLETDKGVLHHSFSDATTFTSTSKLSQDLGIGAWYNGQYLYGGINIDNLLRSKDNVYNEGEWENRKSISFSAQIGTDYRRSNYSNLIISPQLSFSQNGTKQVLWMGSIVKYRSLIAGLGVSTLDVTSGKGLIGIQNNSLRISYSTDVSNSTIENGMFFSHELSLRVLFGAEKNNWSRF